MSWVVRGDPLAALGAAKRVGVELEPQGWPVRLRKAKAISGIDRVEQEWRPQVDWQAR